MKKLFILIVLSSFCLGYKAQKQQVQVDSLINETMPKFPGR